MIPVPVSKRSLNIPAVSSMSYRYLTFTVRNVFREIIVRGNSHWLSRPLNLLLGQE